MWLTFSLKTVSGAGRHTRLALLKIGAVSPKSRRRLTKDRASFSHPHRALATQSGLTPNLEWQLREVHGELRRHDLLSRWLQLLRLPKATRRQPDSITACWHGLSVMNIYRLEALSLPPPPHTHFSRSTAAQGWALTGDPKQPSIDLTRFPSQTVPQLGTTWTRWVFASSKGQPGLVQSLQLVTFIFSSLWALGKD